MAFTAFSQPGAEIFVPDESSVEDALARATHLAIGAHADDLEFFAWHGIDACFGRDDRWFTGIVLTDGSGSPRVGRYASWSDEQMIEVRRAEQRVAAAIGEYSAVAQLAHSSGQIKDPAHSVVVDELVHLLSGMKPSVVYMHNPFDRHDTHVACFCRTIDALRRLPPSGRPERVFGCEMWRGLDWMVTADRVSLPAGERPHIEGALVGVFDSQIAGGKRYDLAVLSRRRANATFDNSHRTDAESGITYAIDLTELVHDDSIDSKEFSLSVVERLANDVRDRLERMG
jgi:LmbE family N-acetylglucosaminyl deacetylase